MAAQTLATHTPIWFLPRVPPASYPRVPPASMAPSKNNDDIIGSMTKKSI